MSGYDDYPTRRERGGGPRQQQYYREEYVEPQDPYLRVQSSHDLVPRGREDSIEEIHRDFPPPGYRRGDVQRARSAEPYDDYDDARSIYSRRSKGAFDDYDDYPRRSRTKKAESVYIEEEERKKKRMLSQQEKIIAAVAGAAVALGGKELFDRKEATEHRDDVHRNVLSSAALGAAGAFAAYQGAEFYNKRADKTEKKSTHIVHRGRDGRVTEYYSDDEDEKQKKGHKNFLESALAAAGLGGALKSIMGGGGGGDKEKDHHGGGRDRSRDGRGETRSRAGSPGRDKEKSGGGGGSKIQKAAMASLIAGATEAFRVSKEPGGWKGEKAKRVLTAAAGAATIDAAQKPGKDGSKLGLAESVIGGLIGNRMINGSKRDIIEDKDTGRSRSRSRARSESGGGKSGGMGLAALATAGLGAIGAKKAVDNIREDRSRSRRRSISRDSYDSRDGSPRRRQRSRSRSVVDTARRGLAKIGFGKKDDDSDVGSRRSGRGGRYSDDDDDYSRDGRGARGAGRRYDSYDDDRSLARGGRDRSRGAASKSRASSRGSVSSSDLGDSDEDEKRAKKMRGKQVLTTGLAAVATIHAAHNVYQSMEKRNARHKAVKAGKLSPEEAKKLKSKALLQDAASVGIAALGIKGAISEMKEAREMSHELAEWREEKEVRHNKRLARLEKQRKKLEYPSDDNYSDPGYASDDDRRYGDNRRSRANSRAPAGPPRRYADDGPHYQDGNPYAAALPAPPVGYSDRR